MIVDVDDGRDDNNNTDDDNDDDGANEYSYDRDDDDCDDYDIIIDTVDDNYIYHTTHEHTSVTFK